MSEEEPAPQETPTVAVRSRPHGLAVAAVLLGVFVVHLWIVSAGKFWPRHWPNTGDYYAALGDAFAYGQVHLHVQPDPRLLALPDPYDPALNADLRVQDAVLYDGRYYFYWGPGPAMLITPFRIVIPGKPITDAYLMFAFTQALMVTSALFLLRIRRQFFPQGSRYVTLLMVAAAGLAMPLPYLLARPAVYETSIVAGQFFLLTGLYLVFTGFPSHDSEEQRLSPGRLALGGLAWALAVGSRLSLAVAVVLLAILVVWRIARRKDGWSRTQALGGLLSLGAPLACGALLLGAYNYARFGSWHESGQRYQLAGVHLGKIGSNLFSAENVLPNAYSYVFRPWKLNADFPHILARREETTIPSWIPRAPFYHTEPITGIVWTTPLLVLLALPAFHLVRWNSTAAAIVPGLNWLVICLLTASLAGFAPILFLIGSTMRYFADLTPPLFIASAIGLWQLERSLAGRRWWLRQGVLVLVTVIVLYCMVVALLLAVTGYEDLLRYFNPELYNRLSRWLDW